MINIFGFGKKNKGPSPTEADTELEQNKLKMETTGEAKNGMLAALKTGLKKTREGFTNKLSNLFLGKKVIDADLLAELEAQLITADIGVTLTKKIIADLTQKLARKELNDAEALFKSLREYLGNILDVCDKQLVIDESQRPFTILLIGVNGSGKTTTIGKLTKKLQQDGKKVLLAAGDTFRAAAIEQLKVWGERNAVPVIAQQQGADSAAVIYDAMQAAKARNVDVLIADTAGRLHTQSNLMDELKKVKRIMQKLDPNAPHEVLLVLDATFGQNGLNQAKQFYDEIGVTGICITKLDGTAKGGIIFAIAEQLKLPIRFIGIGEGIDDLKPFNSKAFVAAMFSNE